MQSFQKALEILMWFRNCQIFQCLEAVSPSAEALAEKLAQKEFVPLDSIGAKSIGFIAPGPDPDGSLVHSANGIWLICLKQEEKLIPSSVLKQHVAEKQAKMEQASGRHLRKSEKQQLKEEIYHSLLPRAFSRTQVTFAYIDTVRQLMVVDAASLRRAEVLIEFLRTTVGSLKLQLPGVQTPSVLMNHFLQTGSAPEKFFVQDACVLKDLETGGSIRCQKQDLYLEDIRNLLAEGREVAQLRMAYLDYLGFVLKSDFSIGGLKFLDGIKTTGGAGVAEDPLLKFDTDFALMTETLREFIDQLLLVFQKAKAPGS